MKIYSVNGRKVWLDENNVPAGAVLCESKKKVEKAEPIEADVEEAVVVTKARRATSNKARKAGSNK